jgi:hypothetical protein
MGWQDITGALTWVGWEIIFSYQILQLCVQNNR